MSEKDSRLVLYRSSPQDEGERQLFVAVDGERIGTIGFGRRLVHELSAGEHRLRIHNTFAWKTVTFDAKPGEPVEFSAINIAPGCMMGIAATLGAAPMFVKIVPGAPSQPLPPAASGGDPGGSNPGRHR